MNVKRIVVSVVGGTVLLLGLALVVLPGPAFLVIPLGLAILATEYVWAKRWLKRAKNMTNKRKAKRTTRVLRLACLRRWHRWRGSLSRWVPWLRHGSAPVPPLRPNGNQPAPPPENTGPKPSAESRGAEAGASTHRTGHSG